MGPSKYPKAWSEWKYDEKKKCLKSTREVSRGMLPCHCPHMSSRIRLTIAFRKGQFEVAYKKRSTNDAPKHTRAESSKAHSEAQVHQDYYQAQEVEYPDAGDATEVLGQNFSNMRMTDYPQEGTVANSQVQLQYGSNDLNHGTSYYSPGIDTATSQGFGSGSMHFVSLVQSNTASVSFPYKHVSDVELGHMLISSSDIFVPKRHEFVFS